MRRTGSAGWELGEIVLRGENILKGYYKNPEATARRFATAGFTPVTSVIATRMASITSSIASQT